MVGALTPRELSIDPRALPLQVLVARSVQWADEQVEPWLRGEAPGRLHGSLARLVTPAWPLPAVARLLAALLVGEEASLFMRLQDEPELAAYWDALPHAVRALFEVPEGVRVPSSVRTATGLGPWLPDRVRAATVALRALYRGSDGA